MGAALIDSFVKLAPWHIVKNPVMAVVWIGTLITAIAALAGCTTPGFGWAVTLILFFTVVFANFSDALAESRGRGQAGFLRRARKDLVARRLDAGG
ncbi:MAG: potassium-transporting ATPase subunit B, partial [Burkholderiales bacterium]|nr:potassium-transporting ATPase subunit B [Burkholderiales bacterium]